MKLTQEEFLQYATPRLNFIYRTDFDQRAEFEKDASYKSFIQGVIDGAKGAGRGVSNSVKAYGVRGMFNRDAIKGTVQAAKQQGRAGFTKGWSEGIAKDMTKALNAAGADAATIKNSLRALGHWTNAVKDKSLWRIFREGRNNYKAGIDGLNKAVADGTLSASAGSARGAAQAANTAGSNANTATQTAASAGKAKQAETAAKVEQAAARQEGANQLAKATGQASGAATSTGADAVNKGILAYIKKHPTTAIAGGSALGAGGIGYGIGHARGRNEGYEEAEELYGPALENLIQRNGAMIQNNDSVLNRLLNVFTGNITNIKKNG